MPRVPIENLPQVGAAGAPGPRISPSAPDGAFGGGQGAAEVFGQVRGLDSDLIKQAEELRQRADLAAVFKATAELSDYSTDVQYNPQTGIVAQKGENAFPLASSVPEGFRKKVSSLMGTLSSPEQRQLFQRQADEHWSSLNRFNQNHIAGQSEHFMAQQADAYVASRQNAGALAGSTLDYDGISKAAQDVDQARRVWAVKNGVTPETADLIIQKDVSKTYTGAIISMLDNEQDLAAQKFFEQHKDSITPQDQHSLAPRLERGTILGESYRQMDAILAPKIKALRPDDVGPPQVIEKTRQEAVAEAAKIENPHIRKMTTEMIEAHFTERVRAQQQDIAQAFMDASQLINQPQNKTQLQDGRPLEAVLPQELLNRVAASPEHLNSLRAQSVDRLVSEPDALLQMGRLVADKAALGKMEISDVMKNIGGRLNTSDRAGLRKAWEDAHESYLKNASTPVPISEVERAVNDTLMTWETPDRYLWGNKPFERGSQKLNGENKERYVAFRDEVYRLAQTEKAAKGRPLVPDEIQTVVDKALGKTIELYKPSFLGGPFEALYTKDRLPYGMRLPGEKVATGSQMRGNVEPISDKDRSTLIGIINQAKGTDLDWRTVPGNDAKLQLMFMAFKMGNKDLLNRIASE